MANTHIIAVAGKGGVGKTTTCGMIIDYLCKQKKGPILVVDADANSNLNEVLGVEVETTLGDIREEMARAEQKGVADVEKLIHDTISKYNDEEPPYKAIKNIVFRDTPFEKTTTNKIKRKYNTK